MNKIDNVLLLDLNNYGKPPKPSKSDPFAQINWLFNSRINRAKSKHRKRAYSYARNLTVTYLKNIHSNSSFQLNEDIDEFFLVKLRHTLELHGNVAKGLPKLKSHTLVGILSAVRQVMNDAITYRLLSCETMQNATLGQSKRETDVHKDYSDSELDQILSALSNEMRLVHRVHSGYQPLKPGVGRDPRIKSKSNPNSKYYEPGFGWKVIENLQWYFENVMNAKPSYASTNKSDNTHRNFYYYASVTHGGIDNVYKSWGVAAIVESNLIMPNVINLIHLTGLNPSSILDLNVDAYHDEHELTGMPYLSFEKLRSKGEMELHLSLLDNTNKISLKRKQALNVKRIIDLLIELTKKIRDKLDEDDPLKNKLIIYESRSRLNWGIPIQLTSATTSLWCRNIVKKYKMRNDEGGKLDFNLVRFRSTKLTKMALEGRDLYEIQQVACHRNISTTLTYINKNKFDNHIRVEVSDALQKIRENRAEINTGCNPNEVTLINEKPIKFYKGLISDCKNTFDPPEWVKKLQDYEEGRPCVKFNMCLFCKNIILLKEHLPNLAAYRSQLLSMQQNNIQNLPNSEHYDKSLELINLILDSEKSEFSLEDIEWAIEQSENIDLVIDPLVYFGVSDD